MSTEKEEQVPLRFLVKDVASSVDKINYNVEQMTKNVGILNNNMSRMNTTVFGDREAKIPGAVEKIEKVEARMEKMEIDKKAQNKIVAFFTAIGAAVGATVIYLAEHLPKILKGVPVVLFYGDFLLYLLVAGVVGLYH